MINQHQLDKHTEFLERQALDSVLQLVKDGYEIDDPYSLSEEQILEVVAFRDSIGDTYPMYYAFSEFIVNWEEENDLEIV